MYRIKGSIMNLTQLHDGYCKISDPLCDEDDKFAEQRNELINNILLKIMNKRK